MIRLNDKQFEVFIREEEIRKEVVALAERINHDYQGKEVTFLAILNGSFMFASDLIKLIDLSCEISFVKVSSYNGTASKGRVDELIGLSSPVSNKHIIILEDIVDTGITVDKIVSLLHKEDAASIKVCSLLYKPAAFKGKTEPDYVGFSIPNAFVVGYGLDYDEKGRNLKEIYQIKEG
jgi:hypoxanthine phosphoribosyltransferase